jgi:hypothetical protein
MITAVTHYHYASIYQYKKGKGLIHTSYVFLVFNESNSAMVLMLTWIG